MEAQASQLRHFLPLVQKVIAQTEERVLGGNNHVAGKVLSLFEPHTQVIRKGKAHKPNEFGRLVRLDEVEHGIVSGYKILEGNAADSNSWMPALDQHQACFGHLPQMATADRGFFSAKNESEAEARGVAEVALPARGRLSRKRAERQKQRWFKRALRWRAGCEATISTLKHPFSMWRATYKGEPGFQRYVGWSVITKNLFSIARRRKLLSEIARLAEVAIFGTLSETYRTCGSPGCHCQSGGPKHGPHLNISYRGEKGKTTGYYVPKGAEQATREGVAAWQKLQDGLRELAELNKERNLRQVREADSR